MNWNGCLILRYRGPFIEKRQKSDSRKLKMSTNLLDYKNLIEGFLNESCQSLSAHSFVNIYSWKDFFDFEFKMINQNLCVFAKNEQGCFLYLPPLGRDASPDTLDECFQIMYARNGKKGISRIENVSEHQLQLFTQNSYVFYKKGYEYCYYRKDLIDLKGQVFKSKRSTFNQFIRNYQAEFLPYQDVMFKECLELYDRWAFERRQKNKEDIYVQMLVENRSVHQLILKVHQELGLVGRVVVIEGNIAAYSFGYSLNDDIFCIFLEVADLKYKGLPTFIFNRFCADPQIVPFKFINAMDDFELMNIAQTKLSFRPAVLFPAYTVTRQE